MIKFLERKRQEELLRYEHKLLVSGYLVGSTAHDTLNHLANIKGYAKLLLDKAKEGSQEREILNSIKSLGERGIELLSRLASFSRESRQEFEAVNINKVIEDAIGLTWPLLKYSQVNIEKALASDIPVIMADKEQLQEVFVILILNALDGASGKTTLKIKTNYLAQSGVVEIVFADTGLKLKDEDLGRRGLDLSLTNAYGIISGHNGKIEIESAGSKGATFIIKLPLKPI
jgi:signal transduction histidine kinase